jgi:signal transduction histidine kinase
LTNAINFSEKGNIVVANEQNGDTMTIIVKDEGVGMTPEQIQKYYGGPIYYFIRQHR